MFDSNTVFMISVSVLPLFYMIISSVLVARSRSVIYLREQFFDQVYLVLFV